MTDTPGPRARASHPGDSGLGARASHPGDSDPGARGRRTFGPRGRAALGTRTLGSFGTRAGRSRGTRGSPSLPPVSELAVATMILVVTGGIYLAASMPRRTNLVPAVVLVAAAVTLLVVNVAMVSRVEGFAWARFRLVAGWALAAYVVIAGMLEFVFVLDHTPGSTLAVMTVMLAVFAVDIPLLLGFSVARYEEGSSDTAAS